ncbi:hypothetical protein [Gorillibacterium sp. sgz5001074]|uniref:hypothetical protein n=1 Tax=Gorillibacterium sp. sgz5001074 TaxID=3446695 RepID=UPI003F667D60
MSVPTFEDVEKAKRALRDVQHEHWLNDELWSWNWWFLLALTVIPYFIWWRYADKRRLHQIIMFGCLIALMGVIANESVKYFV